MPAPPVVHALTSLNNPAPRCGAAGLFLAAALHREYVTCPDCLKSSNDVKTDFKAPRRPVDGGNKPPPFSPYSPEGDRALAKKRKGNSGVSEKMFRQQVVTAAKEAGWKVYFSWTSIHSPAGFPDLVLVKPPLMILAELKTDRGKVTKSQRQWLEALAQVTDVASAIWRPADLAAISRLLAEGGAASHP